MLNAIDAVERLSPFAIEAFNVDVFTLVKLGSVGKGSPADDIVFPTMEILFPAMRVS